MKPHAIPYISTHDREGVLLDPKYEECPHVIEFCGCSNKCDEVDQFARGFILINLHK